MSRSITEPKAPFDAFNPPQDGAAILHDPQAAQAYRDATADARHRQSSGLAPASSAVQPAPAAPTEAPLPMSGPANAFGGRHLQSLRKQADDLERSIQRGAFGAGGTVVEYLVAQQRESRRYVEDIQAEIQRIENLDDHGVRKLAFTLGAR
jgi:hypothetical protein